MTNLVVAATDGSAINNPYGPAGWAWFVAEDCWAAGGFTKASNQVAELFAVLALLRAVPRDHPLLVRTDSQFTVNVATKWIRGWKAKGWKKADGEPPANLALVQDLDRALTGRTVRFEWVRGHNGDPMNELADRICTAASAAIGKGERVLAGPGWTGFKADPVIPRVAGARPVWAAAAPVATGRPAARPTSAAAPVPGRSPQQDGWGANARVRRVTAAMPSSPDRGKPVLCPACEKPMNPMTGECLGCS